jgi:peptidoglycan-associated lipoprotein
MGLGLVLAVTAVGCKSTHYGKTPLPENAGGRGASGSGTDIPPGAPLKPEEGASGATTSDVAHPFADPNLRKDWPRDAEMFKANTIHFDYDSSVIKAADKPKVAAVADYLKANTANAMEIDGHADERGTEEYNRALGERRALAVRAELIRLGIDGTRVDTLSYGKDRPADPGHDEAAHRKNRRAEFLVETAPK